MSPPEGTPTANQERRPGGTLEALGALARLGGHRSLGQRVLSRARRSLSRLTRSPRAGDPGAGLVRSLPIIFEVAAPFERVAPRILPMNWGTCISALHTVVREWQASPTGWTGTVDERVTLGPGGIQTISSRLHVEVVENHAGNPREHSTRVSYALLEENETLLRDEGALAVYRHAQLPESQCVLIVEKTLQFRRPLDATLLNSTGLRAVLQIWLAAAANDECWGSQWRSAVATEASL